MSFLFCVCVCVRVYALFLNCSQFKELHIIRCISSGVYYNMWSNFPWKLTCQCEIVILMIAVNQNVATYLEYSRGIFAACKQSCECVWRKIERRNAYDGICCPVDIFFCWCFFFVILFLSRMRIALSKLMWSHSSFAPKSVFKRGCHCHCLIVYIIHEC